MAAAGMAKLFNAQFVNDIFSADFPSGADVALSDAKNAMAAADAKGDTKAKVAGLLRQADVYLKKKEGARVEENLDEAAKLCRRVNYADGKAYMLIMQAKLELWYGNAEEAIGWSKEAVKLFKTTGDERSIAFASNVHAFVLAGAGKPQEGMQFAKEALMVYKSINEPLLEVAVLKLLMDMFVNAGDSLRAGLCGWEIVSRVEATGGEKKHKIKLCDIIQQIAVIEFQGNDYDKAMKAAEEARALFQKEGNLSGEASVMKTMMNVYLKKNKFLSAVQVAKDMVKLYQNSPGDERLLGGALMDLAEVASNGDCPDDAMMAAGQAMTIFTMAKDDVGMGRAGMMLKTLTDNQRKDQLKLVLEMNKARLGHIPSNLIIDPSAGEQYAFFVAQQNR